MESRTGTRSAPAADAPGGAGVAAEQLLMQQGAFTFGRCARCDWRGPARRAVATARRDAGRHATEAHP